MAAISMHGNRAVKFDLDRVTDGRRRVGTEAKKRLVPREGAEIVPCRVRNTGQLDQIGGRCIAGL